MVDIEHQSLGAIDSKECYGSIESNSKKNEKLPLFLGRWEVSPEKLFRIAVACYVAWFAIHRICDIFYIFTVDARFPEGLGHMYPSEAQRLESVSYTQQVLLCGLVHRVLVFCVVMALVFLKGFAHLDTALRSFPTWLASSSIAGRPYNWCGNFKNHLLHGRFATSLANTFVGRVCGHIFHGRLATAIVDRVGFPLSIAELFLGAVYLSIIGTVFFLLSAPFMYWMQSIDLKFGFANSLSVSLGNFRVNAIASAIGMLIFSVPKKMMFLAVLQYRFGALLMWLGLVVGVIYSQSNTQSVAGMMGSNNKFPAGDFGVGRGFPLVESHNPYFPWISLNRIFWPDTFEALHKNVETFYTNDNSMGQLALTHEKSGEWTIKSKPGFGDVSKVPRLLAKTSDVEFPDLLKGLSVRSWSNSDSQGHPFTLQTHIGIRSGKELRDKLFGFAKERHIGIGGIYMVDGSYRDARANAFVTGSGNYSVIGLYDTLFLGSRGAEASEEQSEDDMPESQTLTQHVSEMVQGVDAEEQDGDHKAPRNSAPTQAMNDDEIVAILAHELAHAALNHMSMGIGAQLFTSLATFATLGWMAHSPLAGAALSLAAPLIHVGSCAFDHLVAPPLEGFMKIGTDGLTRHNEYQADGYATQISEKYGTGLQTALAKLSVNSNQDPDPPWFFELLHADHPTFANRWAHIEAVKKSTYGKDKKALGL